MKKLHLKSKKPLWQSLAKTEKQVKIRLVLPHSETQYQITRQVYLLKLSTLYYNQIVPQFNLEDKLARIFIGWKNNKITLELTNFVNKSIPAV